MEKDVSKNITITVEEYKKLITENSKYKQIKKFIINSMTNNKIIQALCTIEGKNLFDLIEEEKEYE